MRITVQETKVGELVNTCRAVQRDAHSVGGTGRPRTRKRAAPEVLLDACWLCLSLRSSQATGTTSRDEVEQGDDQRVSLNCQPIPVFAVDRQQHSAYPADALHRDWPWLDLSSSDMSTSGSVYQSAGFQLPALGRAVD